jgi:hypothetical protein
MPNVADDIKRARAISTGIVQVCSQPKFAYRQSDTESTGMNTTYSWLNLYSWNAQVALLKSPAPMRSRKLVKTIMNTRS